MDADVAGTSAGVRGERSRADAVAGPRGAAVTDREFADSIDQAIQRALREAEAASPGAVGAQGVRDDLRAIAFGVRADRPAPLRVALACAQAACEHLEFGELLEARTLLTAARGQLALVRSGQPQQA